MRKFIKTEAEFTSRSAFEKAAAIAVSKGYTRTVNSLYANDSGRLVGFWSNGSKTQQRGGWISYCEVVGLNQRGQDYGYK